MITAEKLQVLTTIKKPALVEILERRPDTPSWTYAIKKCRFLGITNGSQFCYGIEYDGRVAQRAYQSRRPDKVFISMTPTGSLTADT